MSAPAVGVLGLGEAGSRLAADLAAAGADVRGYDPAPVEVAGVVRGRDPASAVTGCSLVLGLAGASAALEVARAALPGLEQGAVYADLNTAGPALKQELASLLAESGALLADVALLGPVPVRGLSTPTLASGPGAAAFAAALAPLGMPVEVVSDQPGDAAAMKLLRSVFMKGLAAAALESLDAAEAAGHRDWLQGQLAEVVGSGLLERLVAGSHRHAARRVDEMDAACELLVSLGVEPRIAAASRSVLAELGGDLE
jgi:3-hydroxyisobutyrate dehydrogenase-like beta-hydroxyacid dehydrogenase